MKKGIHPEYKETKITCGCGNVIETRSTKEDVHIEICSKCHPFYSGKSKLVDTAGRIEKFQKRFKMQEGETSADKRKKAMEERAQKQAKKQAKKAEKAQKQQKQQQASGAKQ